MLHAFKSAHPASSPDFKYVLEGKRNRWKLSWHSSGFRCRLPSFPEFELRNWKGKRVDVCLTFVKLHQLHLDVPSNACKNLSVCRIILSRQAKFTIPGQRNWWSTLTCRCWARPISSTWKSSSDASIWSRSRRPSIDSTSNYLFPWTKIKVTWRHYLWVTSLTVNNCADFNSCRFTDVTQRPCRFTEVVSRQ